MEGLVKLEMVCRAVNHLKDNAGTTKKQEYVYEVLGEDGKVICSRKSTRHYVACAVTMYKPKDGSAFHYAAPFFFGRIDLIGKGDSKNFEKWDSAYAIAYLKDVNNESTS